MRRIGLAAVVLAVLCASPAAAKLHVSRNHLVDKGRVVRLLGVNRSGTEYMCRSGFGDVFDGPSDQRSIDAMKTWRINAVRLPLNESCWLGVGKLHRWVGRYRSAIVRYIRLLRRNHLYVIIEDHVSAPGKRLARDFLPMPAASHPPDFWRSVARRFRRTSNVLF